MPVFLLKKRPPLAQDSKVDITADHPNAHQTGYMVRI